MNWKKLFILFVGVLAVALFFWFDLGRYLTLDTLKANRERIAAFHADHRFALTTGFMTLYIVQTALSLPGAAVLSLAAGAIFGTAAGMLCVNVAATCGATLAFLAARYLLRDAVLRRFGPRLEGMNRELEERGLNYLLFLRLAPVFPFFLINLSAGLTRLPLRTFFFGTMFGIIPGSFVYVNAGARLAAVNSLGEIASARVVGSLALLGLFALVPAGCGKWAEWRSRHRKQ